MKTSLRVVLAQINTTVGDIGRNSDKIINTMKRSRARKADLVIFPELALSGYPPEDLLLKRAFLKKNRTYLSKIIKASRSLFVVVGFPEYHNKNIYNAAAIIYNGKLLDIYRKIILPNYGVFDEKRYFQPGMEIPVAPFGKDIRITTGICEDIWHASGPHRMAVLGGNANFIINISSSPYQAGKIIERQKMIKDRAVKNRSFICYCNAVGGQDELVFDGGSLVFGPKGNLIARGKQFEEDILFTDIDFKIPKRSAGRIEKMLPPIDEIYSALVMGVRDYVKKSGFKAVTLGLSGGIDSALTAAICVEALGSDKVIALSMPSEFSSSRTKRDTIKLACNLGIKLVTLPINKIYGSYESTLKKEFKGTGKGLAEENLQARIRGNMLMALSNKFGLLVVTTGNKSEISVGYCTLYGDMAGGFAALKDVPKTMVYKLSEYVNKKDSSDVIPKSIIKRAPTAELRFNQKDQDTLPPYPVLDKILDSYIEKNRSVEEIIRSGFKRSLVNKIVSMVDRNEYKRRQSPPGVKITPKAFGKDRRMPIVNRWKG